MTKWYVEGLIVEGGLNYLTAQPGHGKSLVSLDLAHACTHGRKFLGLFDVAQTKVLYIDQDSNNKRELNKRVLDFGFKQDADFWRMNQQSFRMDVKEHAEWLPRQVPCGGRRSGRLRRHGPLPSPQRSKPLGHVDHPEGTFRVLTSAGITLLLIHHNSRTGGFRGSGEIAAMADAMTSLKKSKGGRQFTLTITKERTLSELTWNAIRIDPYEDEEGNTLLLGVPFLDEDGDEDNTGVKEDILAACAEQPLSKTMIRKAVGGDAAEDRRRNCGLGHGGELTKTTEGRSKMYIASCSPLDAGDDVVD